MEQDDFNAVGPTAGSDPGAPPFDAQVAVDRIVAERVHPGGPGAAVLVLVGEERLCCKGYGLADLDSGEPITGRTVFELASVSKHFTAMAVMILADHHRCRSGDAPEYGRSPLRGGGLLEFDDDVRRYVPELPVFLRERPIRLLDLLWHTSGLPEYLDLLTCEGYDRLAEMQNRDIRWLLQGRGLDFSPGSARSYCNTNYVLLALAVERVSGRPFAEFLRQEVFDPLGMTSTRVVDDLDLAIPGRARGYTFEQGRHRLCERPSVVSGDGNVWSNLEDLERWVRCLRDNRGGLVGPGVWSRMFAPGVLDDGERLAYGFGLRIECFRGRRVYWHGGGWAGYRNCFALYDNGRLAVVVLGNDAALPAGEVSDEIARYYLDNWLGQLPP
jgi:CubicO group peptidase (beta-lactamase class C family)